LDKLAEPEVTPEQKEDRVSSRSYTEKRSSIARILKQEISIILEEGAAPELTENIRQVVMVASRFNRARGDVLSIMTASFKKRRDEKTAEQILLKHIADKLDILEKKRTKESSVEKDWKEQLDKYKQEEAQRREEDKSYFQSKLTELEATARQRAFEQEKRDILKRDSLKLIALNQEIQSLKSMLDQGAVSDSAAQEARSTVKTKLSEKERLDAQIAAKLAQLENVQADLDRSFQNGDNGLSTTLILVILLSVLVLALIIVLAFVLSNRSKPGYAPPPPWIYPPPRRRKKKSSEKPVVKEDTSKTEPAKTQSAPPTTSMVQPEEDPAVLQSEVGEMKKALVSMSVGQPNTATRIVKEWMEAEAPPAPAPPESETPTEEPAKEEVKGKKKKKKK